MSDLVREVLPTLVLLSAGWISLWPLRPLLGERMYHAAAFPIGTLSATFAAGLAGLSGRALDVWLVLAGVLLLAATCWIAAAIIAAGPERPQQPPGARGFLIVGVGVSALSSVLTFLRFTVANNDSIIAYWPMAVGLNRSGYIHSSLMSSRSPLVPGVGATYAAFGSDWAYVFYPVFAVSLLVWIAISLSRGPLLGHPQRVKALVAAAVVAFLVLEPSYIFHSFFVHSHMLSAGYLVVATSCLVLASRSDGDRTPLFLVAGLATAGFALTRPDGLAYMFVVIGGAISVLTSSKPRGREVGAFFGPAIFVTAGSYAAFFARLGLWNASKLDGMQAATILSVMLLASAAPRVIDLFESKVRIRVSGEAFLLWATLSAVAVNVAVYAANWADASVALATARKNLLEGSGGYGYLWYAVAAVIVASMFTGDAFRKGSWTRLPFLTTALFFAVAALVHGTSHPGRIGAGDSFNRVAFHAIPLVAWYVGAVVARILGPGEDPTLAS